MDRPPDLPDDAVAASVAPAETPVSAPALWHAGWALGVGTCASILLLVLGQVSMLAVAALAIAALPGFVGFVWRPKEGLRRALILPWLICGTLAAWVTGGISGPLAAWCLTPLLAGLVLGYTLEGIGAAILAVAAASFAQSAGLAPTPPDGIAAVWLGGMGLACLAAGGGGALMLGQGRARLEQKRAEEEHTALAAVLRDLPAPAAVFDREGRLLAAYGPAVDGLPADWLAQGLVEAAGPQDRSSLVAAMADALDHGSGEAAFAPAAAPDRQVSLRFRRTTDRHLLALITGAAGESRTRGADLWASRTQLETLLRGHPDLVALVEPDGRIAPMSVYGAPPEGLSTAGLARTGLVQAAEPADQPAVAEALRLAMETGEGRTVFALRDQPELRLALALRRTRDGRMAVASLRPDSQAPAAKDADAETAAQRLFDAQSALDAAEAARRSLQAALTEAQAAQAAAEAKGAQALAARERAEDVAKARSRFLANMSHELRTPLNAIMGFSDIMRARMFGELAPKYGEYADLIHESGGHLLDLINDILDMSKIEAERYELRREVFDVREAMSAALRLLRLQADDAGVQLRGVLPQQPLEVDADRRAIKQIVLNLVANALKFTPREGSVTVTAQTAGGALEIVVADTGVGIAPEDVERLGQPFEQAGDAEGRLQGSGLGLSLVKAFARLHGGDMTIESTLGEGTAVTVRLPVLIAETPSGAGPQPLVGEDGRLTRPPVMSGPTSWPSMPLSNR